MATSTQRIGLSDTLRTSPNYQAYQILHIGFTVAPLLAGLDKFSHFW
jgi:hypothetical protein